MSGLELTQRCSRCEPGGRSLRTLLDQQGSGDGEVRNASYPGWAADGDLTVTPGTRQTSRPSQPAPVSLLRHLALFGCPPTPPLYQECGAQSSAKRRIGPYRCGIGGHRSLLPLVAFFPPLMIMTV